MNDFMLQFKPWVESALALGDDFTYLEKGVIS